MKPTLIYVSDAYCCWCYGFSPVVNRIVDENRVAVNVEILSGRMVGAGATIATFFGRFPDPLAIHERVTQYSGQNFGENYLRHIANPHASTLRMDSEIPAKALIAFEKCKSGSKLEALTQIHKAYYQEAKELLVLESYSPICDALGIDFQDFSKLMDSPASMDLVRREQAKVAALGVSGFPAVLLQTADKQTVQIAHGFAPYAHVAEQLKAALSTQANQNASLAGQVCDAANPGRC